MLGHVASRRAIVETTPFHPFLHLVRSYVAATTPPRKQSSFKPSPSQKSTAAATQEESNLINFKYDPFPQPFNCTTLQQTRLFASDPSHPFYIKTQRRVAAHNPGDFIWVTRCSLDISKKSSYRHYVQKKLRRVFTEALRQRGFNARGIPLSEKDRARLKRESGMKGSKTVAETTGKLSGALSMSYIHDSKRVFMAKHPEIKAEAERILDKVLQIRDEAKRRGLPPGSHGPSKAAPKHPSNKQEWQLGQTRQQRADRSAQSRPDTWKSSPRNLRQRLVQADGKSSSRSPRREQLSADGKSPPRSPRSEPGKADDAVISWKPL